MIVAARSNKSTKSSESTGGKGTEIDAPSSVSPNDEYILKVGNISIQLESTLEAPQLAKGYLLHKESKQRTRGLRIDITGSELLV